MALDTVLATALVASNRLNRYLIVAAVAAVMNPIACVIADQHHRRPLRQRCDRRGHRHGRSPSSGSPSARSSRRYMELVLHASSVRCSSGQIAEAFKVSGMFLGLIWSLADQIGLPDGFGDPVNYNSYLSRRCPGGPRAFGAAFFTMAAALHMYSNLGFQQVAGEFKAACSLKSHITALGKAVQWAGTQQNGGCGLVIA